MIASILHAFIVAALVGFNNAAPSLTVTGTGSITLPADCASIVVSISSQDAAALKAQKTVARTSSDVFKLLTALKATQITTQSLTLNTNYNYSNTPANVIGFTAQTTISFSTAANAAGSAIDNCIAHGVTDLQSISFQANVTGYAAAAKSAAGLAVQDALAQANAAAAALKMCVSNVTSVGLNAPSTQGGYGGGPVMYAAESFKAAAPALPGTTVQAGDVTASATATVEFQLGTECLKL
ncbi:hypothetical protein BC830DRAFT_1157205 [Chytriomyces sp. MP71]|nr:hypothetical protein BC830DRAFT_1157205 [Chytriomyces sp. MP71]